MAVNNSINAVSNVQIFTSVGSNTWIKPAGVQFVYVECIGGGGGGGGGATASGATYRMGGGGGGGGALSNRLYSATDLSSSEPINVASGGTGGAGGTTATTVGV